MRACGTCGFAEANGRICGMCGVMLSTDSLLGATFDGLTVLSKLGSGQCGEVYRAWQVGLSREVALKVPSELNELAQQRFAREIQALGRIQHPGVVAVHATGVLDDGRPYVAMELLPGETLEAVLRAGPLPVHRALAIAAELADALGAAHARSIVHRDLKPSNVMMTSRLGEPVRAVLIDFGVASDTHHAPGESGKLTRVGDLVGTPHYMAPEQISGEFVSGSADQYALGVLLFRMLTGRVPFAGGSVEVAVAHVSQTAPAPSIYVPGLPPSVDAIVARCLAKTPAERFPSMSALASAFQSALQGQDPSRRAGKIAAVIAMAAMMTVALGQWTATPTTHAKLATTTLPTLIVGPPDPGVVAHDQPLVAATVDNTPQRDVLLDDSGVSLRLRRPAEIVANTPQLITLDLWDPDGEPVGARELVITVEDPTGSARGLAVPAVSTGHFALTTEFLWPGAYILRVFPPIGDVSFAVDFDVGAPRPAV